MDKYIMSSSEPTIPTITFTIEWIDVKIQKPNKTSDVWVIHEKVNPNHPIRTVYDIENNTFSFGGCSFFCFPFFLPLEITHWFPIPELPKKKNE